MGAVLVAVLACVAIALMCYRMARSLAFTVWVFTSVTAAMVWPQAFDVWFGYDLKNLVVPLVQIIMFGMGTKLSVADFARVFAMPWPVFIGLALHYTVMPLAGFAIARLFGFPAEVAAGVILVGSVSSGAASNLIAYLAGGNVALAVTVTACSTLISPIMTPFLMQTLAGRMVPIDFLKMLLEIFNIVIVPVVAGLAANRVLYGARACFNRGLLLGAVAAGSAALAAAVALAPGGVFGRFAVLQAGAALGLSLIGLVALAKLIVSVIARRPGTWMDRVLPLVSMIGICVILAIITARSRERLLTVGGALIIAAMLHNAIGYLFGYWLSRAVRLDETTCRTIAIEVGMQNGGMATGLAMGVLKSADAALAPAIFGPWMNISGSILASWWRRRPVPALAANSAPGPRKWGPPLVGKETSNRK
ncbi:MAG TPA: bile acid:sodium symporter family protein [Verrucomicrobiae bacterium]